MLISIIIPVYNVERYVAKCINSVLNQTYTKDIECFIIDDGSTDNSGKIIDDISKTYTGPIKLNIVHTQNHGCGHARNIGLEKSIGEGIMFVDSDDELLPNYIESFVNKIKDGIDYIQCAAFDVSDDTNIKTYPARYVLNELYEEYHGIDCQHVLYSNNHNIHVTPGGKLYKRAVIANNLYSETLKSDDDLDFNLRVGRNVTGFAVIYDKLYIRNRRSESITNTSTNRTRLESMSHIINTAIDNNYEPYLFLKCLSLWLGAQTKYRFLQDKVLIHKIEKYLLKIGLLNLHTIFIKNFELNFRESLKQKINYEQSLLLNKSLFISNFKNLKTCLVAMCKMENRYLDEGLNYHRNLGFDKIILIDNNDTVGENSENIYDVYTVKLGVDEGGIKIFPLNDSKHLQQIYYQKVYEQERKNFDWFLFLDIDEFLVLREEKTINEFLNSSRYENVNLIALVGKNYGDSGLITVKDNNYSCLNRFTKVADNQCTTCNKCFVKSVDEEVLFPNPHTAVHINTLCCNSEGVILNTTTGICSKPEYRTYEYAYIAHYITKTLEEWIDLKIKRKGSAQGNGGLNKKYTIDLFFTYNKKTPEHIKYLKQRNLI